MKPSYLVGAAAFAILAAISGVAQIPLVNQGLSPVSIAPGSLTFTLTVNGTGFTSGAVVNWNGSPRMTKLVSSRQLKATIEATDVAKAQTARITVTNPPPHGGTSNVVFFPVTGKRSTVFLTEDRAFPGTGLPETVVLGDFNNDGNLDIAWNNANSSSNLTVSLGNGKGGFSAPIVTPGSESDLIVAGDFNGDGKLDIVEPSLNGVTVYLGNGDGTFRTGIVSPVSLANVTIAAADFNRDGCLDLYISGSQAGPELFQIWTGNCDGTFTLAASYLTGSPNAVPIIPAIGDFNGDGYLDLIIVGSTSTGVDGTVWLGGKGGFSELGPTPITGASLATADVNHDGKLDLTDGACVYLGNGDGTFGSCLSLSYFFGEVNGIGDFNGDGNLDIANNAILLGTGNGTFPTAFQYFSGGTLLFPGAIGDFNNDGKLDVVTSNGYVFIQTAPPPLKLTPASLAFGDQKVGTTSPQQTATLTNLVKAAVTINQITIVGKGAAEFAQTNDCGASLSAGASCTISVTFSPKATGTVNPALSVSYTGVASPQTVSLTGTGT